YRAHIKDLYLANQPAVAERYLERLCVLEPAAAKDPTLRPAPEAPKIEPPAAAKAPEQKAAQIFPDFAKNIPFLNTGGKAAEPPTKPPTARAVPADETGPTEPPFDQKTSGALPPGGKKPKVARQWGAKADENFKQKRSVQARAFYEKPYQVGRDGVAARREP